MPARLPRSDEPVVQMLWDRILGLAELAAGDYAAATTRLAAAVAARERIGFREPAIWRIEGDAIEAAVGAGDLDGAHSVLARARGGGSSVADPVEPRGSGALPRSRAGRRRQHRRRCRRARSRARRARRLSDALRARAHAARGRPGAAPSQAEAAGARVARTRRRAVRRAGRASHGASARGRSSRGPRRARRRPT